MTWSDIFADPADRERVLWARGPERFAAAPRTTKLLSFERVDEWLRFGGVRYPQFQLNLPQGGIPPTAFTETRKYLALVMPGYPNPEAIAGRLREGATLRLVNVEDFYEPVAQICARLTELAGARVTAYAFYTPPGDDGVGAHFDNGNVFALQVEGSKRWHLWDIPDGVDWQHTQTVDGGVKPDHVVKLSPGDGLYIPAGVGHRAFAGPEGSLHLSIVVTPTSHHDVVRAWVDRFLQNVPIMDRLPLDGDRTPVVADLLRELALAAEKADPAELLAAADVHRPKISTAPIIPRA
jgi:cupin superfamily protein